jgi:3-oxoacyl-[acyl-carrier-protein] synthase-3
MMGTADRLGLPRDRVFVNVDRYGNTSSATIPIALAEAHAEGRLQPGDRVLFTAFGGGLSWGSAVVEWGGVPATAPALASSARMSR